MKKLWNEFKEFAFKGNVIDMAVGVILGTAITAVVTSLVQDIIMPVLSAIIKIPSDITELTLKINNINIKYGSFLSNLIDYSLVIAPVVADLCTTPVALSAPPNSYQNNSQS